MKGNDKIIQALNSLLADELTAVNQYMVHSEMAANWGYKKLHEHFREAGRRRDEARREADRPDPFPGGDPDGLRIPQDPHRRRDPGPAQNDHEAEDGAVKSYNKFIALCGDLKDFATREILEGILNDEDRHIDEIEELQDQIGHMTLGCS